MIGEIVAEAKRERHAGGMPPSAKQEQVAAEPKSSTGQYLRETLAKTPVSSPAQAGGQAPKAKGRRKASADQLDLISAK